MLRHGFTQGLRPPLAPKLQLKKFNCIVPAVRKARAVTPSRNAVPVFDEHSSDLALVLNDYPSEPAPAFNHNPSEPVPVFNDSKPIAVFNEHPGRSDRGAAATLLVGFSQGSLTPAVLPPTVGQPPPRLEEKLTGFKPWQAATSTPVADPLPVGKWAGLKAWRCGGVRDDLVWGENGPQSYSLPLPAGIQPGFPCFASQQALEDMLAAEHGREWSLVSLGQAVLASPCLERKVALVHLAHRLWEAKRGEGGEKREKQEREGREEWETGWGMEVGDLRGARLEDPVLPAKPELVHPRSVPKPGAKSPLPLSAHLLHSLAHVELNAIHLALDTALRFSPLLPLLGRNFFGDFLRVAADEARHFVWCQQRLMELGFSYGNMCAHNLLWVDSQKSSKQVQDRLAIIPMVQEARGLDAGPRLAERLIGAGDSRSAAIVGRICEEELAHVAVGVTWFEFVCQQTCQDPYTSFREIIQNLSADGVKGPFNHEARALAGLPRDWYDSSQGRAFTQNQQRHDTGTRAARKDKSSLGRMGEPRSPTAVPRPQRWHLEEVQLRLATMMELEDAACDGISDGK